MEVQKLWRLADTGAQLVVTYALQGVVLVLLVLLRLTVLALSRMVWPLCRGLGRFVLGCLQVVALMGVLLGWLIGKVLAWLVTQMLVLAGDVLTGYESYRFFRQIYR